MDESKLDYIRRRHRAIGMACLVAGAILAAILLPRHEQTFALVVLMVLFAAFYAWATTSMPRQTSAVSGLSETIGDHFKRTRTLHLRITVPICFAWIGIALFYPSPLTELERFALAVGGGWVFMFMVHRMSRAHCPRCHTDLWKERVAKLGWWSKDQRGPEELWDACPHCGVRFDERWCG